MASSTVDITSVTASALSTTSGTSKTTLTTAQIAIVVGSVGCAVLVILILILVISLRRSRHQKYEHAENCSKSVDDIDSPQASKDDSHSMMFNRAEADPLIITETEQNLPPSESQYLKNAYTRPSSSPVKKFYAGLPTYETHVVPLDIVQSPPKDNNVGFEIAPLRSGRPSSSKSTIKLAPLTIPAKALNRSNGKRSHPNRTNSRKSSKPPDSGWETDDSASLYSVASAATYLSKSSLETIKPTLVPSIPIRFTTPPTQSTSSLPKGTTDVIMTESSSPPLSSLSPLSLKFNGNNNSEKIVEEELEELEDEIQIYNVAKLLHSRQSKLPPSKDSPSSNAALSRNSSNVSHIERSGSIISPTDEKSYRPRYYRLKQKKDRDPFTSNLLSPTHIPTTTTTTTPYSQAPQVGLS